MNKKETKGKSSTSSFDQNENQTTNYAHDDRYSSALGAKNQRNLKRVDEYTEISI
jgi:hypothetical protein